MNAIVEVETAQVSHKASEPVVIVTVARNLEVQAPVVSTSTLRVISQGSHSISAVAPDAHTFKGGLALAAA